MLMVAAVICGVLGLIAGGLGFTGILKGLAGAAKALFFGLLATAGVLAAIGFFAAKKIGG